MNNNNKFYFILDYIVQFVMAVARDIKGAIFLRDIKQQFRSFAGSTIYKSFEANCAKHPNKPCILFEEETWTFKDLKEYSNKIAWLFKTHYGLKKGDCVALFMENKPEYVGVWLGLSKLGVITALVNTNLKNEALLHSITIAKAVAVVFGSNLEECST